MKKEIKVYLEESTVKELESRAGALGIKGRGWLTRYLEKLVSCPIVFLDDNVRSILSVLNLQPKEK